jgi:hypothetical protein
MESIKIAGFATMAAILYGILHDQVTAHVCVEYFTIAHQPIFPTESPFLLAIGWGIIATWWVGLILGLGLSAAARAGSLPKLSLADLRKPVVALMAVTAIAALLAGIAGGLLAGLMTRPAGFVMGDYAAFTAVSWAHEASYSVGAIGGLILIGCTLWQRKRTQPG